MVNIVNAAEFTSSGLCSTGDSGLSVCLGQIPGPDNWSVTIRGNRVDSG